MYLFFDTETTGLPNFTLQPDDDKQPRILQAAMLLTDEKGNEMSSFKTLIKPDGWTIDEREIGDNGKKTAFAIHGITNAVANKYGMTAKQALLMFRKYESMATLKIAHNYRFDGFLMKGESMRAGLIEDEANKIDRFCTMKAMTEIMKLGPTEAMKATGRNFNKSANLMESYEYWTGQKFDKAHDAMADVRACKTVFFNILEKGLFVPQARFVPEKKEA